MLPHCSTLTCFTSSTSAMGVLMWPLKRPPETVAIAFWLKRSKRDQLYVQSLHSNAFLDPGEQLLKIHLSHNHITREIISHVLKQYTRTHSP